MYNTTTSYEMGFRYCCPNCGTMYTGVHVCTKQNWSPGWSPVVTPATLEDRIADLERKIERLEAELTPRVTIDWCHKESKSYDR